MVLYCSRHWLQNKRLPFNKRRVCFFCTTAPNINKDECVLRWSWCGGTMWLTAAGRPSSPTRTPSRTSWSACCVCVAAPLSPSVRSWKEARPSSASSTCTAASSPSAAETPASSSIRWLYTHTNATHSVDTQTDSFTSCESDCFSSTSPLACISFGPHDPRNVLKINHKMRQK